MTLKERRGGEVWKLTKDKEVWRANKVEKVWTENMVGGAQTESTTTVERVLSREVGILESWRPWLPDRRPFLLGSR